MMSASNGDRQRSNCEFDVSGCGRTHPSDLVDEFCRRCKLDGILDNDDDDADCAASPEYSEYSDYTSMTGSCESSTTLPPGQLNDRLAALSVSSGDSFCLYDSDEDDGCSISTLENPDDSDDRIIVNPGTSGTDFSPSLPPPLSVSVEEDLEFNFLSTKTTVCRSASLKSSYDSTPPCSPRTKKAVRFADALGLDLESVRHILDVSDAPPSCLGMHRPSERGSAPVVGRGEGFRVRLMPRFSEPGSSVNFLRRVQERKVSLEEVIVDAERLTVSGVVRVANIAYQKKVTVRYSVDYWATYHDHSASYLPPGGANTRYDGGLTDAFTFQLNLPPEMVNGRRLEFSVQFVAGSDLTFWDSNFGANYAVDCVPAGKE